MGAQACQRAVLAFGPECGAYVSSVKDEPVVGTWPQVFGNVPFEFQFYGTRGLAVGQSQAVGDTEDVRIHGDDRFVVDHRGDHVRRLPAYALQGHQRIYVVRDVSVEVRDDLPCHFHEMDGLAVGIGYA